jgi:diguanylate cyclase (GGDEF)-like protein/putative nucleotidyltransferase with HDIG domain
MKDLSSAAKQYIWAVLLSGGVLGVFLLATLTLQDAWLLLGLCALTALLQVNKTEGATARSSYNPSWILYGMTFVLLGAPAAFLAILVAHLVEWVRYRYPWYIQCFNIASFAITVTAAAAAYQLVRPLSAGEGRVNTLALIVALLVFTLVNHLLVGVVIKLARGQGLRQSGVFSFTTLMMDFGMLSLGASSAFIWQIDPTATVLIGFVAYLVHIVLRVPALERQKDLEPKTGLYNAQYFEQALHKELARLQQANKPLCLVMADLDRLRDINNTYGHLAGDAVINKVAQILQASARDNDIVARFGGEEFNILMPNTTPEQAYVQVEAMRKAIEAAEFTVSTSAAPIKATMSFGIAHYAGPDETAHELTHHADLAVYEAKHTGRNRICVYTQTTLPETSPPAGAPAHPTASQEPLAANRFSTPSTVTAHPSPEAAEQTTATLEPATADVVGQLQESNAELVKRTEEIYHLNEELLLTLASTIDLRDPYVLEHSRQVARYAVLTAQAMALSPERAELVYRAGLMHDIGKLTIPEAILFKPDRLTLEEYEIVKEHAAAGAELLANFATLRNLSAFVRHHHERYDGQGYPDQLAGEQIPLEARILALADAVEAMASDRPYRIGMTPQEILTEIERCSGTQFDPSVVQAFNQVVQQYGEPVIVNSAREVYARDAGVDTVAGNKSPSLPLPFSQSDPISS